MDLGQIAKQAGEAAKAVAGDETKTDAALDAVAGAAKKVSGGRFDSQIDSAREVADSKLGNE